MTISQYFSENNHKEEMRSEKNMRKSREITGCGMHRKQYMEMLHG